MKLFQLSRQVNIPVDLIQKWQKLIPELNDEDVDLTTIQDELKAFSIIKDIPQYNFLFYSTMNNSK